MAEEKNKEENQKDHVLEWAWKRFALYDSNSILHKKNFLGLQKWILVLGLMATFLALLQTELLNREVFASGSWYERAFQYVIVSLPIIVSILIAASNRFKPGNTYILLRAGAEGIKREIYRYRVHAGIPETVRTKNSEKFYNDEKLVERINGLHNRLMQSELNRTGLSPYAGQIPPLYGTAGDDDGFKPLRPEDYLKYRLVDQLNYYQKKTTAHEKQLKRLHWLIYIFGGLGTLLASIGFELWVALTTALVGVFTTYMEYQQVENTLMLYNQTAASLSEINSRWDVLPPHEKNKRENILPLLESTEDVLLSEHHKWIQQMEETLANLREQQAQQKPREPESKGTSTPPGS